MREREVIRDRFSCTLLTLSKTEKNGPARCAHGPAARWPRRWRARQGRLPRCWHRVRAAALTSARRTGAISRCYIVRSTAARLGAAVSRLFFNITKLHKLTHASQHDAGALRAEEFRRYFNRWCSILRLRRQCGNPASPAQQRLCWQLQLTLSVKEAGPSPAQLLTLVQIGRPPPRVVVEPLASPRARPGRRRSSQA